MRSEGNPARSEGGFGELRRFFLLSQRLRQNVSYQSHFLGRKGALGSFRLKSARKPLFVPEHRKAKSLSSE